MKKQKIKTILVEGIELFAIGCIASRISFYSLDKATMQFGFSGTYSFWYAYFCQLIVTFNLIAFLYSGSKKQFKEEMNKRKANV